MSPDARQALKDLVKYTKDEYKLSTVQLADRVGISRHSLSNFLSDAREDPRGQTLATLADKLLTDFLREDRLPVALLGAYRVLQSSTAPLSFWGGDVTRLFPGVDPMEVHVVPRTLFGSYVVYRRAAVPAGSIVRAKLDITPMTPNPMFENAWYDSGGHLRYSRGWVINVGGALHLIGHIARSPTLKLIVFELPEDGRMNEGDRLRGLVISNEYRDNRFFAARCVALRTPDPVPVDAANVGVFSLDDLDDAFSREYEKCSNHVDNSVEEGGVLFLDRFIKSSRTDRAATERER